MKLATFINESSAEAVGVVDTASATVLDLQAAHRGAFGTPSPFFHDILALIDAGDDGLARVREVLTKSDGAPRLALDKVRLLAPIPEPRQLRDCNNFEQHMRGARIGMEKLKARWAGKPEPKTEDINTTPHPINFKQPAFLSLIHI